MSTSTLEQQVVEYLTVRRALGFKLTNVGLLLRQFVRYLDQHREQRITINTAIAWAVLPQGSDSLHYGRLSAVRGFATHLRAVDPTVEIPGVELLRNGPSRRRPFLYTEGEILALIDACGTLRTAHRAATYRTLIGLLASTGIRAGEAIGLDRDDFDPPLGVIVVRGKLDNKLRRKLPLSLTTTSCAHEKYPGRAATGPPSHTRGSGPFVRFPWQAHASRSMVWSRRSRCCATARAFGPGADADRRCTGCGTRSRSARCSTHTNTALDAGARLPDPVRTYLGACRTRENLLVSARRPRVDERRS